MAESATIFERAAEVFDATTDPDTGLRVLRILPQDADDADDADEDQPWRTVYHQTPCFLEGGRRVMLRQVARGGGSHSVDLTTGEAERILPQNYYCMEVCDQAGMVLAGRLEGYTPHLVLWDLAEKREVSSFALPGWRLWSGKITADGRRVIVSHYQGTYYDEHCVSQLHVFDVDGRSTLLVEADGFFCNHIMPSPTHPDIFTYNRWPTPPVPTEVVIHIRDLNTGLERPLPQLEDTVRPGPKWGAQRDHYLWTPDGKKIVSYFSPQTEFPLDDHYHFGWWVSAIDLETGQDTAVPYPEERWGGNFAVSRDSRYILTAGGREFQKLYRIDIDKLAGGWNEEVLCSFAHSTEDGKNNGPFHMPHVLPDQSGVIFSAGWPGPDDGTYLVEWPRTES